MGNQGCEGCGNRQNFQARPLEGDMETSHMNSDKYLGQVLSANGKKSKKILKK